MDPVNCDKYNKREGTYLQYSHAPQNIVFVEHNDEEGYVMFFWIMAGFGVICAVVAIVLTCGPAVLAFLKWLGPGFFGYYAANQAALARALIWFILGLVLSLLISSMLGDEPPEKTPEEMVAFFASLKRYCEKNNINAEGAEPIMNPDGTITVTFADGSEQTFRQKPDGTWEPVQPKEPETEKSPDGDPPRSPNQSQGNNSDNNGTLGMPSAGRGTHAD
ncbi:MAG: hypothetical protein PVF58_16465 [Candidatus Methanofastidiosia archaeon]|jgi:hypothetical protein